VKARTKTIEVIATRDDDGVMVVWDRRTELKKRRDGSEGWWVNAETLGYEGALHWDGVEYQPAQATVNGGYCGIRKGGMKRLSITTTVKEVTPCE
jgi:hypothetical protein